MFDVFAYTDYRQLIKDYFKSWPNQGHGLSSKLARALGVNTTLVSQILSGKKTMTEEQAIKTTEFIGLNQRESYYFLLLVQVDRANTPKLQDVLNIQISRCRDEAKNMRGRVSPDAELNLDQQADYYSNWVFAAVHTIVSIESFRDIETISAKLKLSQQFISSIVDLLLSYGLLTQKNGKLSVGKKSTYLAPTSPFIQKHHENWRHVSFSQMTQKRHDDFYFTAPMSISEKDFQEFRKRLTLLIGDLYKVVGETKPEQLACINLDFFKI